MYVLIPGRHHLLTNFQFRYLFNLIETGLQGTLDIDGKPLPSFGGVQAIIFAVTSANHSGTRRNPLPLLLRAMQVQAFSRDLSAPCYVYGIDDAGNRPDFASYVLKTIKHESDGLHDLKPENTVVVCATRVLESYEALGYPIFGAELIKKGYKKYHSLLPWEIVERIAAGKDWYRDATVLENMHPASLRIWRQYGAGDTVRRLFSDPIVGDDGDLTETRDYASYVRQMDEIAQQKYQETSPFIQAGKIGDIGCAVGSWLKCAATDPQFGDSEFYGIEVTRALFEICRQRKENGEFKTPLVFFAQKNAVVGHCFEPHSMHTIHTGSLTHEIRSYGSESELRTFIRKRYEELLPGGVWINRDVVGPEKPAAHMPIWIEFITSEGPPEKHELAAKAVGWSKVKKDRQAASEALAHQSPLERFAQFAADFLPGVGDWAVEGGTIRTTLEAAAEFLLHKDYADNWRSEMHESFCHWSFSDWVRELTEVGFEISPLSRSWTNPWIVKNRWQKDVRLWSSPSRTEPVPWPHSTMAIAARKPR